MCRDGGLLQEIGGDAGVGIFRAPPGRPGVERQFSEPSMMKSSLSSRAPAQLDRMTCRLRLLVPLIPYKNNNNKNAHTKNKIWL